FTLGPLILDDATAHRFLSRKPLYNHWDFELFTPGNLQRECIEEICNYEEMREVFEDDFQTAEYGESLGLGSIITSSIEILKLFCCTSKVKVKVPLPVRASLSSPSLPSTPGDPSPFLSPCPKPESAPGLPTYDQVLETSGVHDAPPPPYHRYKSF
uniref:Gla domain-containing protein n=1 Tax=Podarcis muralis TaxID=64176 RepID=A0A670JKH0_PODMU